MKGLITFSTKDLQLKYGDFRALEIAKKIGSDGVDFALHIYSTGKPDGVYKKNDEEIIAYFKEIKEYADRLGLVIGQTHGRVDGYTFDEQLNLQKKEDTRRDLLATSILGAPVCVSHMVSTILVGFDVPQEEMLRLNKRMYLDYLRFAKEYKVKIAFETFGNVVIDGIDGLDYFAAPEAFLKAYNELKQDQELGQFLTACVDTGHTNKVVRMGVPTPHEYIRLLGSEVTTLHLNDNDGGAIDQHKIPLSGSVNWPEVFKALDSVNYCGNYNMELKLDFFGEKLAIDTAEFAIKIMRELVSKHIKQ